MKNFATASFAFLLVCALAAPSVASSPPSGSYQKTCKDIHVETFHQGAKVIETLHANCQKADKDPRTGKWYMQKSSLQLPCRGDIRNEDGFLWCW